LYKSYDDGVFFAEAEPMNARVWIFCSVALLPLPALADAPVDFSGEWLASAADKSGGDDAAATSPRHDDARSGMGGRGGHGGGMGGSGMGHHGRHSQDSAGGDSSTHAAPMGDPRLHAHTLIIRQSEVVFDVAADGQRMAYRFDNRNNYGAPYGGTVTLTWSEPEMVIETHPDGGGSIEEHYTLAPDSKRLTLHIREQKVGEDTAREFTRVFVRNEDAAAPAENQPTLP
jgi:hypothetical protein